MNKTMKRILALVMTFIMLTSNLIFASSMKDVSSSHWAYSEIMEMQKRGLLVTNSKGEFFPNNYVTYFEFSKALAKATGYKDEKVNPNMDSALKKDIKDNYEKQRPVLQAHQKNYDHWQMDANPEIAYLLGRGYLEKEDLGKFMSKSTSGAESKRGVRKQEAVVYLVRILQKAKTAESENNPTNFNDDDKINSKYRPYIGYFKKLGLINGDQDGNFRPTEPITRATFSKMLVDTLNQIDKAEAQPEKPQPKPEPKPDPKPEKPGTDQPAKDQGIEGKLTKMISKGENSYYIVIEVEADNIQTYALEITARVTDKEGKNMPLEALKNKLDSSGSLNVTGKVSLLGTTEYMTDLKLVDEVSFKPAPENPKPQPKPEENLGKHSLEGVIYSVLIAPVPEVTIQLADGSKKTYTVTYDTEFYNNSLRQAMPIWDLRINQRVQADLVNKDIERLEVTSAAPPVTLTGTISRASVNGDEIDIRVAYDSVRDETNLTRTIQVPMWTQITDGRVQRARKDFKENMQVVVVFGEDGAVEPEQIIIISK